MIKQENFWFGNIRIQNEDDQFLVNINYDISNKKRTIILPEEIHDFSCTHNYLTVASTCELFVFRLDSPKVAYRSSRNLLSFEPFYPDFSETTIEDWKNIPFSSIHSILTSTSTSSYYISTLNEQSSVQRLFNDVELADDGLFKCNIVQNPIEAVFIMVASGYDHTLLLSNKGEVFSFGTGSHGELGTDGSQYADEVILVRSLENIIVTKIVAGGWHSAALTDTSDCYVWGWNNKEQLGISKDFLEHLPSPLDIDWPIRDISATDCGTKLVVEMDGKRAIVQYGSDIIKIVMPPKATRKRKTVPKDAIKAIELEGVQEISKDDFSKMFSNFEPKFDQIFRKYCAEIKYLLECPVQRKTMLKDKLLQAERVPPKTPKPKQGAFANILKTITMIDNIRIGEDDSDFKEATDDLHDFEAPEPIPPPQFNDTPVKSDNATATNDELSPDQHRIGTPITACQGDVTVKDEPASAQTIRKSRRTVKRTPSVQHPTKSVQPKEEPLSPEPSPHEPIRRLRKTPQIKKSTEDRATAGRNVNELLDANAPVHRHIINTPTKPERREPVQKIIDLQDRIRKGGPVPEIRPAPDARPAQRMAVTRSKNIVDDKLKVQLRRAEQAQLLKIQRCKEQSERLRRANEEKSLRVQRNREEQLAKEREKQEKLKQKEEERAMKQVKSPARTNPSSRVASPSRVHKPMVGTPRSQFTLFNDEPTSTRTPGRTASKAAKLIQLNGETGKGETFASPAREIKRKLVAKIDRMEIDDERFQKPSVSEPTPSYEDKMELLMKEQRKRLLEEKMKIQRDEEVKAEKRLEAERLEKEREAEREAKLLESMRLEEKRIAEEKARIEAETLERLRQEEDRRKREDEEKRREDERLILQKEQEKENIVEGTPKPKNKLLTANKSLRNDSYEMTPEKVFLPSSKDNYNIEDLSSGDETDNEDEPRKAVPQWANWNNLRKAGEAQFDPTIDYTNIFGFMFVPSMEDIFGNKERKKSRRRQSSGKWNSPASNPTKGTSKFLGF